MKIHVATHKKTQRKVEIEFSGRVAEEHQEILDGKRTDYSPEARAEIQKVSKGILGKDPHGNVDENLEHHF